MLHTSGVCVWGGSQGTPGGPQQSERKIRKDSFKKRHVCIFKKCILHYIYTHFLKCMFE